MDNEVNEVNEVMDTKCWLQIPYSGIKDIIRGQLNRTVEAACTIGYYLKRVRDEKYYLDDGYETMPEMAYALFGIRPATVTHYVGINDRFSIDGNDPRLLMEYREFSTSKLQEMLYLDDEQLAEVTPDMTVREIRQMHLADVKEKNAEAVIVPALTFTATESQESRVMQFSASDLTNYECEGQMVLEDYPGIVPVQKIATEDRNFPIDINQLEVNDPCKYFEAPDDGCIEDSELIEDKRAEINLRHKQAVIDREKHLESSEQPYKIPLLWIRDKANGKTHLYGTDTHDSLWIDNEGNLNYRNLQNGDGTGPGGDYEFVDHDEQGMGYNSILHYYLDSREIQ